MNWLYSNAVGGVKLQVKELDVQRTIKILRQEPVSADSVGDKVREDDDKSRCPKCNSLDVDYEKFSRRLVFASWLLLGIPFPIQRRKWKCRKCGYQWKYEQTDIEEKEIEKPEYTLQAWASRKNVIMEALNSNNLAERGWAANELEMFSNNEVEEAKEIFEKYNQANLLRLSSLS